MFTLIYYLYFGSVKFFSRINLINFNNRTLMSELDPKTLEEDQHTEFKESFNERALKSVCAFANNEGGSVYVPVKDNLKVVNHPLSDQERQNIANRVIDNLGIQPQIKSHTWKGRSFIEVHISQTPHPVHLKGRYYKRVGNTTQRMTPDELQRQMLNSVSWDNQIAKGITLKDLDKSEIKRFVTSGQDSGRISSEVDPNDPEAILKQTNLLREDGFTNAALLLFGNNPQIHFPAAVVRIGEFSSESEIINDKIIKGHLFDQVRSSEEKIKSHLKHGYKITDKEFTRQEQWTYPLPAIREGLMNALIHRNYHRQGDQIQIKIFPNRLSIFSPGGLPDELSVDDLLTNHPSIRRNNLLADIFFRAGLIESFGTGISRIRKSLKEAGMPEPILNDKGYSFILIFNLKNEETLRKSDSEPLDLNERQEKALELAEEGILRTQDLATFFTNVEKRTLRRDLKELVEEGLLEAKGKTSNRYYQLKE